MAQVILLERVENLGNLGDVVSVKPGFARNYLIPQSKALRATDENIAYFEAKKSELESANEERKKAAGKQADKLKGLKVVLVRHASEHGQLYGSVTARDIAETITSAGDIKVTRGMVTLNDAFKTIGLFDVPVALHPEVIVDVRVNVARSADEAEVQFKTGKALIADEDVPVAEKIVKAEEKAEEAKEKLLDEEALEAEKEAAEEEAKAAEAEASESAEDAADEKKVEDGEAA